MPGAGSADAVHAVHNRRRPGKAVLGAGFADALHAVHNRRRPGKAVLGAGFADVLPPRDLRKAWEKIVEFPTLCVCSVVEPVQL